MAGAVTGILDESYSASAVITAMRFVKITGSQTVGQNDTAGGVVKGVAKTDVLNPNPLTGRNEVADAKDVAVQVLGVAWVETGADLSATALGTEIMSDNVGRAVAATSTNHVVGRLNKGAASGGLALVELIGAGQYVK